MQFFKVKKKITISIKDSRSCFDKTIINNSFCGFLTPLNKKKKKNMHASSLKKGIKKRVLNQTFVMFWTSSQF